jgi:hypothetical protein
VKGVDFVRNVVIFASFSLEKYLHFMGWRKLPDNHWASNLDGQVVMLNGDKWKCNGYRIDERWLEE